MNAVNAQKANDPHIDMDTLRRTFAISGKDVVRIAGQRGIGGIGNLRKDGYRQHVIGGKLVLAHRIAFALENGRWPSTDIDHIDRDRANNSPANLREVTYAENRHNTRINRNNLVGLRGVDCRSPGCFRARIRIDGVLRALGNYPTAQEAHDAYQRAAREVYGG